MSYFDEDVVMDEDGNIIKHKWDVEREREEAEEKKLLRESEHRDKLKEADRIASIDRQKDITDQKIERNRKLVAMKNEWATMPMWVKSLPRTPLSAPPTEGASNKMKYKLTGKVTLTDSERKSRIDNLNRLKKAMDCYRKIHQDIFIDIIPTIAVIPISDSSGGTVVTRLISKALSESRSDLGIVVSVDLGTRQHQLSDWFKDEMVNRYVNFHTFLNIIRRQGVDEYSAEEILAKASKGEYYLVNSGGNTSKKVDPTSDDIALTYQFLNNGKSSGIAIFDCDPLDHDSMAMSAAISSACVFVVDPNEGSERLKSILDSLRREINDKEVFDDIMKNSVIVGNITSKDNMTKEKLVMYAKEMKECAFVAGINPKKTYLIPFESSLSRPPLQWNKVSWTAKNSIRNLCGDVINMMKDSIGYQD